MVLFLGGTDNPYNYNGIGYDGNPAEPQQLMFAFDGSNGGWVVLDSLAPAAMDLRGLVLVGGRGYVIGGMTAGQRVTSDVWVWTARQEQRR